MKAKLLSCRFASSSDQGSSEKQSQRYQDFASEMQELVIRAGCGSENADSSATVNVARSSERRGPNEML